MNPGNLSKTRPDIPKNGRFGAGVAGYTYRYYDPLTGRWPSRHSRQPKASIPDSTGDWRRRGKNLYDELYTQKGYKNNSAKAILIKRLKAAGIWNTGGHFGDLSKSTKEVNATNTYVNTRSYSGSDLDDLGSSLGRFQMTANVEGNLILDNGLHVFCYQKVATYVVDSYDFNDSVFLVNGLDIGILIITKFPSLILVEITPS